MNALFGSILIDGKLSGSDCFYIALIVIKGFTVVVAWMWVYEVWKRGERKQ